MKKWIQKQKPEKVLLVFAILYCLLLGILLSYNYQMNDNYNILFDSDTARVVEDATEFVGSHYRADVHPLFVLFVQPVAYFVSGIVMNKMLAIILLSSIVSGFSVYYIYKILDSIQENRVINIGVSLIYLFSFSNMIFTSGIEIYNFAALFLIMMWYYFLKQEEKPLNGYSYVLLILFGLLTFGFTISNVCIFIIMIFLLWIMKKIKIKTIILLGLLTLSIALILNIGQTALFNSPVIWGIHASNERLYLTQEKLGKKNVEEVVKNNYYNSLMSNDIHMELSYGNSYNKQNYVLTFNDMSIVHFLLISIFYILGIFLVVRNFKKKKWLNLGLLLSLIFNTGLHLVYGNNSTFLYSLHFEYIIILLLGINLLLEENKTFKKWASIYLGGFLVFEFLNNHYIFYKVLKYVGEVIPSNFLRKELGWIGIVFEIVVILLGAFILYLGFNMIKKILKEKKKEIRTLECIAVVVLFFFLQWMMLELKTIEENHRFLWKKIEEKNTTFTPKEKVDYLDKDFIETFQKEIKELDAYI